MKIAVATVAIGARYGEAVRLGIESKVDYCDRNGYTFIYQDVALCDRPHSWSKIPLLQQHIGNFDVIFWSDADVLITNPHCRLEDILAHYPALEREVLLLTRDSADNVNAGNFFLFNRPQTSSVLAKIWNQEQFTDHPWWESKAVMHLLETDPEFAALVHVEASRPNLFNAYIHVGDPARNYRDGDLLLHFAGVGDSDRIEQLMRHHHAHTRVTAPPPAVQGRPDGAGWVRALMSRFRGP